MTTTATPAADAGVPDHQREAYEATDHFLIEIRTLIKAAACCFNTNDTETGESLVYAIRNRLEDSLWQFRDAEWVALGGNVGRVSS